MGSFKDVVGHKDIIQYLHNAISEDQRFTCVYSEWRAWIGKEAVGEIICHDTSM